MKKARAQGVKVETLKLRPVIAFAHGKLCLILNIYSGTPLIQTLLGQKKVSCLERCPYFRGVLIEGFHCTCTCTCVYVPQRSHVHGNGTVW